jgi:hypothetical protein
MLLARMMKLCGGEIWAGGGITGEGPMTPALCGEGRTPLDYLEEPPYLTVPWRG